MKINKMYTNRLLIVFVFLLVNFSISAILNKQTNFFSKTIDMDKYYAAYSDPYVISLRNSFNAYLIGSYGSISEFAKKSSQDNDLGLIGLDSFDRKYFGSKFVVWTLHDNPAGGKSIQLVSKEHPDRVFDVWVYQLSNGEYELRSFSSKKQLNVSEVTELKKTIEPFLIDKHEL